MGSRLALTGEDAHGGAKPLGSDGILCKNLIHRIGGVVRPRKAGFIRLLAHGPLDQSVDGTDNCWKHLVMQHVNSVE